MLTQREFAQLATMLANQSRYQVNDDPMIPLNSTLQILATFTEGDVRVTFKGNSITWRDCEGGSDVDPTR